jgi:hypothetical protein
LAEERVQLKRLKEISAVREALRSCESEHLYYKAQRALAIARAVRETLATEKKLAVERIKEAELCLQALAAKGKLRLAERQLGDILNGMEFQGLLSTSPRRPQR